MELPVGSWPLLGLPVSLFLYPGTKTWEDSSAQEVPEGTETDPRNVTFSCLLGSDASTTFTAVMLQLVVLTEPQLHEKPTPHAPCTYIS